jgi:hypothetical protein
LEIIMNNLGKFVIVRTYSAGVHVGTLQAQTGTQVTLQDARRIWRWRGANTLNELSLRGCDDLFSRISEPVQSIDLTEAIEIIPCTEQARVNLSISRWGA